MFASTRSTRRLMSAGTAALVAASLAACGGNSLSGESDDGGNSVKIGLVVPASGVYEPLGTDMTNGFQLYLDEHDGQLGGKDVEVVKADEGEGPDTGVPAVNKVITQDQVSAVVGIVNSATALGVKEQVTQAKVPLIIANAGANDVADGSDYVWRTSFRNGTIGESLGKEVASEVGDGSVYVMAADYAAGQEYAAGFIEAFEAAGGTVAGESFTPFGTTSDWQPYLTKAQNSGASAVYAFYAGAEAVNFVKQYKSFGLSGKIQLYGPGFLTEGGVLAAQGAAAEGVRTSLHYSNLLETDENAEFVEAYTEAYDMAPTVYSVQAYDAAQVLDLALEGADGVSGEAIAAALADVGEVASPRGAWSFDENHSPEQPYFLREVQATDGGFGNVVVDELAE
jgi:branched-chain amino acid transport system substrate-binding protein